MILIFGGAYQGKLDWAKKEYHIKEEEIFFCTAEAKEKEALPGIDLDAHVIYSLESFTLDCVRKGIEAKDYMRKNRDRLENKMYGYFSGCSSPAKRAEGLERNDRKSNELSGSRGRGSYKDILRSSP